MKEKELELKQPSEAPTEEKDLKQEEQIDPDVQEEEEIDYAVELAKAKEERDNYKEGMLSAKQKLKDGGNEDEVSELKAELDSFKKDLTANAFEDTMLSMSENADERELIKHHYDNSLKKTGYTKEAIANDLQTARLLANRKKIERENKELRTAIINKTGVTNNGVGSNRSKPTSDHTKLNPAEQRLFDRTNANRVNRGEKPLSKKEFINN